jgi:hypothetical protein
LLALLVAGALACSFSESSESSSDSSNHSSDSSVNSSQSSSPGGNDNDKNDNARFQHDVEQYTLAFLQSGGRSDASFFAGLGDVARSHGVSDWEAEPTTWEAIGRGLARSAASDAERSAFRTAWTGGDAAKQGALARGVGAVQ